MEKVDCKKCHYDGCVKAGIKWNKQRFLCKKCGCRFVITKKRSSAEKQFQTLMLYLEGMPIRGIGRYLEVSHVSVIRWIKKLAERLKPVVPMKADHIEIDELYLYIKSKKNKCWLWTAICRESKRILGFELGGRNKATLRKLFSKISPIVCEKYHTDGHAPYKDVLPENKHSTKYRGTNTIEGIYSSIRHFSARFRRKSKCYSKSEAMVEATLVLLMFKYSYYHSPCVKY